MTEGDLVIVFSQYGEIVDCRIVRDKESGKSKGFGFICYEDQRSTILAVDNLNGANICGRTIRVDHVEQFKIPKEYFEIEENPHEENFQEKKLFKPTGPDGKGWGKDRILSPEDENYFTLLKKEEELKLLKQHEIESDMNKNYLIDNDERWEKEFERMIHKEKDEELERSEKERTDKKLKKEKKLLKKEKKKEKKEKKKIKKEKEIKELYGSYGIKNFIESKPNIQYIPDFIPKNKTKEEEI